MPLKICILHANCQGDPLRELLLRHEGFSREYAIHQFVNYTREFVDRDLLSRCDLFLHQHLGSKWGGLSSESLREELPPRAKSLCIPNLFFKAYWPLWNSDPIINYSDLFLNHLVDRGLSKREIIHLYVHTDLTRFHDLDRLINQSLEQERAKEQFWDMPMVDRIWEGFRRERLFNTVNHPNKILCLEVANKVLQLLGFSSLAPGATKGWPEPFGEFELPIHPQVAKRLDLSFVDEDSTYNLYGASGTFVEYVNYYVECRRLGESDFISYLRLRAGQG